MVLTPCSPFNGQKGIPSQNLTVNDHQCRHKFDAHRNDLNDPFISTWGASQAAHASTRQVYMLFSRLCVRHLFIATVVYASAIGSSQHVACGGDSP